MDKEFEVTVTHTVYVVADTKRTAKEVVQEMVKASADLNPIPSAWKPTTLYHVTELTASELD